MTIRQSDEIKRRERVAREAIQHAFETGDAEDSARLFVSHHLEELKPGYWRQHLSTAKPEPSAVLGLLVLRSHWGEDDELETFDFTLPDNVTQYVLCVRFDEAGNVADVAMES